MPIKKTIRRICDICGVTQITRQDENWIHYAPCNKHVPGPPSSRVRFRASEVIIKEPSKEWQASLIECDKCGTKWAVAPPADCEYLECPICHHMNPAAYVEP